MLWKLVATSRESERLTIAMDAVSELRRLRRKHRDRLLTLLAVLLVLIVFLFAPLQALGIFIYQAFALAALLAIGGRREIAAWQSTSTETPQLRHLVHGNYELRARLNGPRAVVSFSGRQDVPNEALLELSPGSVVLVRSIQGTRTVLKELTGTGKGPWNVRLLKKGAEKIQQQTVSLKNGNTVVHLKRFHKKGRYSLTVTHMGADYVDGSTIVKKFRVP